MRKNFFLEKKHHYFSIKKKILKKNYIHHIYEKPLFIFPFCSKRKQKFCANVSRNVLYVLEKKDFSFPSIFPTIFIDSTQKLKKQIRKCEKRSFCLSLMWQFFIFFIFNILPFLPSKIQNIFFPSPNLPLCVQNLK